MQGREKGYTCMMHYSAIIRKMKGKKYKLRTIITENCHREIKSALERLGST